MKLSRSSNSWRAHGLIKRYTDWESKEKLLSDKKSSKKISKKDKQLYCRDRKGHRFPDTRLTKPSNATENYSIVRRGGHYTRECSKCGTRYTEWQSAYNRLHSVPKNHFTESHKRDGIKSHLWVWEPNGTTSSKAIDEEREFTPYNPFYRNRRLFEAYAKGKTIVGWTQYCASCGHEGKRTMLVEGERPEEL